MQTITREKVSADQAAKSAKGFTAGTLLATADGYLPVEYLDRGDRIITREGMRKLRMVKVHTYSGPAVTITGTALGHERPEQAMTLPAQANLHLRGALAMSFFRVAEALIPARWLVDGKKVQATEAMNLRVYELFFDTPQVIYAEGIEVVCEAMPSLALVA